MAQSKRHAEIEALEHAFWKSMVENKPKDATAMLAEPALMVSGHGIHKFDHAGYAKMANDARFKLLAFEITQLDVLFPTDDVAIATYRVRQKVEMEGTPIDMEAIDSSTWVNVDGTWKCASHTESLVPAPQ